MKLKVDPDLCTGCEDCTQASPALFKLGPDWIARVVQEDVPPELQDEARKTKDLCQFEAIFIEEEP
ncbi:MAG: ferredoxin [Verrucomicrobia bacterium]|nr:ferredoxin [Verrucomicrobiota bacterium]MCH8528405.1 ferredoxin [Kiritimatiellia bacterium]